jgi:NAD-dependent DNA ligase
MKKKDIFDLRLGENKRFSRPQAFYHLIGDDIMLSQTYGVWYTTWKKKKCFFLKSKSNVTSRRWTWSIEANCVFSTLEDAKIGLKHKLIKKYEDLLEHRKKDITRIDGLLSNPDNFNVVDIINVSYDKNRWRTLIKFKEEERQARA